MNKKTGTWLLILIIVFSVFSLTSCSKAVEKGQKEPLLEAFEPLEAHEESLRLMGWILEENSFLPMSDLQSRAETIANQLQLTIKDQLTDESKNWHQVRLVAEKDHNSYEITYQSLPQKTYLIVDIQAQGEIAAFESLRYEMDQALGQEGDRIYLIMASLPGYHSAKDLGRLFDKALVACDAKKIASNQEGNYICYSGYIKGILPETTYQDKKVNIQLAGDYNKKQDTTYIYLGMPLVFSDY
ncbi:MAG: YwmB family TATA-box binding protein [Bacillota bacterium]|jgi:hypothetical protein